jgi:hypothetical protein
VKLAAGTSGDSSTGAGDSSTGAGNSSSRVGNAGILIAAPCRTAAVLGLIMPVKKHLDMPKSYLT